MNTSKNLALLATLLFAAEAQARNPGIVPPDHSFHGMTYSEWSAEYWKWAMGSTLETDPIADTTGEFGALRQAGPVWFLANNWDGTTSRTLTVPAGKFLFVPIVDQIWVNLEVLGDRPWSIAYREYIRSLQDWYLDDWDLFTCEIDGEPVSDLESYRFSTAAGDAYMVVFPDDNWFGIDAGIYGPTIDEGRYLLVRPLSVGEHTIHFTSESTEWGFPSDVTYELTVE
jgi:hypothetical protein